MEEEARAVLAEETIPNIDLAGTVHARFRALGGVELRLPARRSIRETPKPGR
jgi:hypothetical protein